jgi:glycosyltransferase 2 family protein
LEGRLCQITLVTQAFTMIVSVFSYRAGVQPDSTGVGHEPADDADVRRRLPRLVLPAITAVLVVAGIVLAVLGALADQPSDQPRLELAWLGPAIAWFAILELVQAELWRRLLIKLGGQLQKSHGLAVWCVSAMARYVPTSMLTPIIRVRMSRARSVPGDLCIASVIYEAVLVNCGAACVAAYFVVSLPALKGDPWRWLIVVMPAAAILVLHPRVVSAIGARVLRRMGRPPLAVDLSLNDLLRFASGYTGSFFLAGLGLIAVVFMFHPLTWQGAATVMGAMSIGFLASVFAFVVPGGLGVREAALILALSPVMPALLATSVAVVTRLLQLAIEVMFALLLPWVAYRKDLRRARVER